jgi:5-methylthioadenosine/S-adenosylhomocysteine deaminase
MMMLMLLLAVVTFAIDRLGLFGPNVMAAHMTQLTNEEIKLLAATQVRIRSKPITCLPACLPVCLPDFISIYRSTQTSVIHCPESNMKLTSGYCPVRELIAAGVNVALGITQYRSRISSE